MNGGWGKWKLVGGYIYLVGGYPYSTISVYEHVWRWRRGEGLVGR